jgi:hypothetical protein
MTVEVAEKLSAPVADFDVFPQPLKAALIRILLSAATLDVTLSHEAERNVELGIPWPEPLGFPGGMVSFRSTHFFR